ncbi:hypothetical protein [Helicobacter pylori]|uniref:hypothetical protein n=1 Tax=Helicobacter pylori TaxID=210 RepID=UPI002159EB47|nr:hypothetical protein [Helicobacter pylori]
MLLDWSNLNEEPLKSQIKAEFFKDKKFLYSGDKIDFMLSYKHSNATLPILWGEAKRGDFDDLDKAFTQLLLTIGKHRLYTHHLICALLTLLEWNLSPLMTRSQAFFIKAI